MLFFIAYYLIKFFFNGTYWIFYNSFNGVVYLINKTKKQNKIINTENTKKIEDIEDLKKIKYLKEIKRI